MKKGPTKTYKEREQAARVTSAAHRADIARPAGLVGVQRVDSKLRSRIDDVLELGLGKQKVHGQRLCRLQDILAGRTFHADDPTRLLRNPSSSCVTFSSAVRNSLSSRRQSRSGSMIM